jgi:PilZ domain-containing protein
MLEPTQERRAIRRFDMRLPASVRLVGSDAPALLTETQNVSARGVYFYLDQPLALGSEFEVTLTLPPHITLTDSVRIRFHARVVRIEELRPGSMGVGALIEEYEFVRSGSELLSQLGMSLKNAG